MTKSISYNKKESNILEEYERSYYGLEKFGKSEILSRTYELSRLIADYVTKDEL